eukprot:3589690-Lingulodinium_polyedra.AAC.1
MQVLYCKQQPLEFHGLLLQRCPAFAPNEADRVPSSQETWSLTFSHNWECSDMTLTTAKEGKDFTIADVVV